VENQRQSRVEKAKAVAGFDARRFTPDLTLKKQKGQHSMTMPPTYPPRKYFDQWFINKKYFDESQHKIKALGLRVT